MAQKSVDAALELEQEAQQLFHRAQAIAARAKKVDDSQEKVRMEDEARDYVMRARKLGKLAKDLVAKN